MEIHLCDLDELPAYSEIPIAFLVETVFQVKDNGIHGIELNEIKIAAPFIKDYDAVRGEGPTRWLKRFDMSNWGIFRVFDGNTALGGAIVAPGAYVGDMDTRFAQLFDIRVQPERRREGIGTQLLRNVVVYLKQRGLKYLKIETQNTNVPACKFYAGQGCYLGNIDRYAYTGYPELEHETRLVWYYTI